jgi:hypothetical protein
MRDVFGYDSFWRILVCKHGPQAHGVRRHLREHHHITIPVEQQSYFDYFSSLRCRTCAELEAFLGSLDQPVRPVEHIDVSHGFHCPDCDYLTILSLAVCLPPIFLPTFPPTFLLTFLPTFLPSSVNLLLPDPLHLGPLLSCGLLPGPPPFLVPAIFRLSLFALIH